MPFRKSTLAGLTYSMQFTEAYRHPEKHSISLIFDSLIPQYNLKYCNYYKQRIHIDKHILLCYNLNMRSKMRKYCT